MASDINADFVALVNRPTGSGNRVRKLAHLVARDLRGMILRGELARGQMLPSEADLLEAFEISRESLREALRILESEGLIHIRRGRGGGVVVQQPEPRAVIRHVALLLQVRGATNADIHEVRRITEPPSVAGMVDVSAEHLAELTKVHELALASIDDPPACVDAVITFDDAVMCLAGNTTIATVSGVFRELIAGERSLANALERGSDLSSLVGCHGEVLDALASGDPRSAGEAWSAYLEASSTVLGSELLESPFDVMLLWQPQGTGDQAKGGPEKRAALTARDLRSRIAQGELKAGDPLVSMPELAVEYGVSRPIIRECLRMLELEGLITLRAGSGGGPRVLEPSTDTAGQLATVLLAAAGTRMIDVFEARHVIEPPAFELMAERADDAALQDLASQLETLEGLVEDTPRFVDFIAEVERSAFGATRNVAIAVALEMIHWVNIRCRHEILIRAMSRPQVSAGNRLAAESLATCVEAAKQGDPATARRVWAEHLTMLSPHFREAYGDRLIVDLFD